MSLLVEFCVPVQDLENKAKHMKFNNIYTLITMKKTSFS